MQIYIPNTTHKHIILFDVEYDNSLLVQLAFLILTRTNEPNIYALSKSINIYVKPGHSLNSFFTRYTNITNDFLCDNGVDLAVARTLVEDNLLDIDVNDCIVVSHGIKNDLDLLFRNQINFKSIKTHYCTYTMARKLLHRNNRLSLKEVAADGGYYMFNEHNAYADVWGTLYAFCYLKEVEAHFPKVNNSNLQ